MNQKQLLKLFGKFKDSLFYSYCENSELDLYILKDIIDYITDLNFYSDDHNYIIKSDIKIYYHKYGPVTELLREYYEQIK